MEPVPPLLPPSSSPPAAAAAPVNPNPNHNMLLSVFLALFLPCAGMSAVFIVYVFLLWYTSSSSTTPEAAVKDEEKRGLSASELDKLPKMRGEELGTGRECAVCLEEIEREEVARVVPGCNHGFHMECADAWLSMRSACPLCRANINHSFPVSYDQRFSSS